MINKSFITLFIVFIDQVTKRIALHYFKSGPYYMASFAKISVCWNSGVSFSMCSSFYTWVLKLAVVSMCIILFRLWQKSRNKMEIAAYSLILGGGVSNLIDRFVYDAVLDFISLRIFGFYMPIFNIADIAITLGLTLILWDSIFHKK